MDGFIKRYIGWQEVHKLCNDFAEEVQRFRWKFDHIIAVGKGGLVPATIIGSHLKLDVINIGLKSYTDANLQAKIELYQRPTHVNAEDKHMNILVIDDINDSGNTFHYVAKHLATHPPYMTAYAHYWSLFRRHTSTFGDVKEDRTNKAVDEIEIYTQGEDIFDNGWLVMPWENKTYVR